MVAMHPYGPDFAENLSGANRLPLRRLFRRPGLRWLKRGRGDDETTRCLMVNPMEIMPILAMAFAIACIPVLSAGPFERRRDEPETEGDPEPQVKPNPRIRLPHPRY
jgi:hypothetical protein